MNLPRVHVREAHGVEMIIAIDSTVRGPALGGCRWKPYPNHDAARRDALALATAMTRKAALARLALGGGKAVVIGDPRQRSNAQLEAFGEFVDSLGGEYITAADMGTGEAEMARIGRRTRHVVGLPRASGGSGDPGPYTAEGVRLAIEACLARLGRPLAGALVSVQGAGSVGAELIARLLARGARVRAADPAPRALAALPEGVERVSVDSILWLPCDVLAPCGPPGSITSALARELDCAVVCGAANNPLEELDTAAILAARGILYAPDFVANAGGLIHLSVALDGGDEAQSLRHLAVIPENLEEVFTLAKSEALDPARAAEKLASARAGVDEREHLR